MPRALTRRRRAIVAVGVAAALAFGVTGCSKDDGGSSATTTGSPSASTAATSGSGPATSAAGAPGTSATDATRFCAAPDAAPTATVTATADRPKEASGVVPDADGGAWTLDDSGNPAALYHLRADGSVDTVAIEGVTNTDWEELIADRDPTIAWIADTGDNLERRDTVQLHRIVLDDGATALTPTRTLEVTYADDHYNVEAGVATSDAIYLLSKNAGPSTILRVPLDQGDSPVAEAVGEFTPVGPMKLVTGAALAPDGRTVLVRTYLGAWAYPVDDGGDPAAALETGTPCRIAVGNEAQGEAIGFLPDGSGWATVGEGEHPTLSTFVPRSGG